jgi:hypothetical protein
MSCGQLLAETILYSLIQNDDTLKSAITQIGNVTLSDDQWTEANLPDGAGSLGIRSVPILAW